MNKSGRAAEYYQRVGATSDAFTTSIYQAILGRSADDSEMNFLRTQLDTSRRGRDWKWCRQSPGLLKHAKSAELSRG